MKVGQVAWTDTRRDLAVATAIEDVAAAGGVYTIDVPLGMTRQVWLTFQATRGAA